MNMKCQWSAKSNKIYTNVWPDFFLLSLYKIMILNILSFKNRDKSLRPMRLLRLLRSLSPFRFLMPLICKVQGVKYHQKGMKKPKRWFVFENSFTFGTFKLFLPKNDFIIFIHHLMEGTEHQKNKNWWIRHKCPYPMNPQDPKY